MKLEIWFNKKKRRQKLISGIFFIPFAGLHVFIMWILAVGANKPEPSWHVAALAVFYGLIILQAFRKIRKWRTIPVIVMTYESLMDNTSGLKIDRNEIDRIEYKVDFLRTFALVHPKNVKSYFKSISFLKRINHFGQYRKYKTPFVIVLDDLAGEEKANFELITHHLAAHQSIS